MNTFTTDWRDLGIRAARTFGQAVLAMVLASSTGILDADVWRSAAIAGLTAVLTLVHGWLQPPSA